MANNRIAYSPTQQIALVTQVNQMCPLCFGDLFYKKGKKTYKNYELAHIYPLNPKEEEQKLLKNEEKLSEDVNNEANIIPLCTECHTKFDKPRTVEEYRTLVEIKKKILAQTDQHNLWKHYQIESDIANIINSLLTVGEIEIQYEIFSPRTIDNKIHGKVDNLTRNKVKNYVKDYYYFVRYKFIELEKSTPGKGELISSQVKCFYLKQKSIGINEQMIFHSVVNWINAKTSSMSLEGSEIIASFFIQNCEVF